MASIRSRTPKKSPGIKGGQDFEGEENDLEFLASWLALIEVGMVEPEWSTLAQRLEFVGLQSGMLNRKKEWAEAANMTASAFSNFLSGERGSEKARFQRVGDQYMRHDFSIEANVLKLINAAKSTVELFWVLGGPSGYPLPDKPGKRCRLAANLRFANKWGTNPRIRKLPQEIFDERAESIDESACRMLCELVGPSIPMSWLLRGEVNQPELVRSKMELHRSSPKFFRWTDCLDDQVQVVMTVRDTKMVLRLLLNHPQEIPENSRAPILEALQNPMADRLLFAPIMHRVGVGFIDDREIRRRRYGLLWNMFH